MLVALGSDHAGFALKQALLSFLRERGETYRDFGCYDEQSVDYPDVARQVAESVAAGEFERGIVVCGTGIGVAITANKVPGIRAATCHDTFSAHNCREHNDANVLCLGGRVIGPGLARDIVAIWLSTPFGGEERHRRRIAKISQLDQTKGPVGRPTDQVGS